MPVSKDKVKFIAHLYPETVKMINNMFRQADCRSRSQFVEQAVRYYAGYLMADDDASYLPNAMLATMKSLVAESESKISKAFFKLAVELGMIQNAFAYSHQDITEESLAQLRRAVEHEVKCINGMLTLEDAVEWQKE